MNILHLYREIKILKQLRVFVGIYYMVSKYYSFKNIEYNSWDTNSNGKFTFLIAKVKILEQLRVFDGIYNMV